MGKSPKISGWPLPVKLLLAVVVLAFVWSPFLALLMRLANVNPSLAPDRPPTTPGPQPATTTPSPGRPGFLP